MNSQILNSHKWEERVVLILSHQNESSKIEEQAALLLEKKQELSERRLIVYIILNNKYKQINTDTKEWLKNKTLNKIYNPKDEAFKVILIGLDGSIKLNQNSILTPERLFSTIDGMPMRKQELKNKNN
ncbi:DUF4174 domain-containing protein [Winogradskyella sp. PE311]|uniref:DUF4174 domain-containing protein n=1 Tax=Winogradskyella sp. PE311 TaxID=3366943 RepID=UPI00397F478F